MDKNWQILKFYYLDGISSPPAHLITGLQCGILAWAFSPVLRILRVCIDFEVSLRWLPIC